MLSINLKNIATFLSLLTSISLVVTLPINNNDGKEKQIARNKGAHGYGSTCAYFDWSVCGKKKKKSVDEVVSYSQNII